MLCFRDMTFCASDCVNSACIRHISVDVESDAKRFGLPMSVADMSGSCSDYQVEERE